MESNSTILNTSLQYLAKWHRLLSMIDMLITGTYRQGQVDDVKILCVASESLTNGHNSIFGPMNKYRVT